MSKRIVWKSVFSILGLALFIYFENFESITEDKFLISVFGGLFLGAGIGLAIKNGAVLDGSEILGIFINDRFGISIGTIILFFNILLFAITALVLSVEVAMYSVLTYLVTAKTIDFMIEGFEDFTGLMIVTKKPDAIENTLIDRVGTGITVYKGVRGFGTSGSRTDYDIIHVVINRIDIKRTYKALHDVDDKAFIIEFDVNNVTGGLQKKYLKFRAKRNKSEKAAPYAMETDASR